MVLNTKGQFFFIGLTIIVIAAVGIAYFTSEAKQAPLTTETPEDVIQQQDFAIFVNALREALAAKLYSGEDAVAKTITELENHAAATGRNFTANCTQRNESSTFFLDCELALKAGEYSQSYTLNHSYTVPYEVTLYSDAYSTKTTRFSRGDTVYYRVTSTDSMVNFSVYDPNETMQYTRNETFSNYRCQGSFVINSTDQWGKWTIKLNNTEKKTFYVDLVNIEINTYNSSGMPETNFGYGDTVYYNVTLEYANGTRFDTEVSVDVTRPIGKPTDYGSQGASSNGVYSSSFVMGEEVEGTLMLTATEHKHYWQATHEIMWVKS